MCMPLLAVPRHAQVPHCPQWTLSSVVVVVVCCVVLQFPLYVTVCVLWIFGCLCVPIVEDLCHSVELAQ
jgi:hypothetical protein